MWNFVLFPVLVLKIDFRQKEQAENNVSYNLMQIKLN